MLTNLITEMKKSKITQKVLATELKISTKSVWYKVNGFRDFTSSEMYAIRDAFFPEFTIDYLFKKA